MSVNQAIKEANKMADKAILKSKFQLVKKATCNWLNQEIENKAKRWQIIAVWIGMVAIGVLLG